MNRARAHNSMLRLAAGGWTLLETLLVVSIIGIMLVAAASFLQKAGASYSAADPRIMMVQDGRVPLAHLATALRQARAVTACTDDGAGAASLEFLASDGTPTTFSRETGSSEVRFGPTGSPARLGNNCSALSIGLYADDGTPFVLPLADPAGVASAEVAMTVVDPDGRINPITLTDRIGIRRSRPSVVVNEIYVCAWTAWTRRRELLGRTS